jgi:hypothetical protein
MNHSIEDDGYNFELQVLNTTCREFNFLSNDIHFIEEQEKNITLDCKNDL